jgi:hypothetical protein
MFRARRLIGLVLPTILSCFLLSTLLTGCSSANDANSNLDTESSAADQSLIQPPLVEEREFNKARKSVYLDIDDLTGTRVIRHNDTIKRFKDSAVAVKGQYLIHVETILNEKASAEWELQISSFYVGEVDYIHHYRLIFRSQDQRLTLDINQDQRKEQKFGDFDRKVAENSTINLNQNDAIMFCKIVEMDSAYMLFEGTAIFTPEGDIPDRAKLIYKDICTVYFGLLNDLKP